MQQGRNNRRPRGPWNTQDQARQLNYSAGAGSITPQNSAEHNRSEPNSWKELKKELEEAREQVVRQKNLKEVFINKEKATRDELERLKRASDPETMIIMRIASEARSTIKTKKKKELQNDFEDLKVAQVISQQKFSAELKLERETNASLHQELEKLKLKHQTSLSNEDELKVERKKMSEEIQTLLKNFSEKEKTFFKDLEDLKDKQASNNQEMVAKLLAEEEVSQGLRKELIQLKEEQQDKVREQEKEKEALEKEVEELKAKLQNAETLSCCQEEMVKQLTTELQREVTETDSLQKEVETNKLLQEKNNTLHKEVRELKLAHAISQEKFSVEIQVEKDTSKALQQELEKLKLSNLINLRYETELEAEKEKSDSLQKQLDKETQAKAEKAKDDLEATKQLMAEKKGLEEEVRTLKDNASEKEKAHFKDFEDLKEKQASTNLELVARLEAEKVVIQGLLTEHDNVKEESQYKTRKQEKYTLPDLPDFELLKGSEGKKKQKLSVWKKLKRSMGLTKNPVT